MSDRRHHRQLQHGEDNFGRGSGAAGRALITRWALICGIGLLVTADRWIIVAYTYRKVNNQPIAP
jgi:hypothetical protein